MKASELIKKLQELIEEHGDLDCTNNWGDDITSAVEDNSDFIIE